MASPIPQFCGAQAEFAVAASGMIAPQTAIAESRRSSIGSRHCGNRWQMLFQYAQAMRGQP